MSITNSEIQQLRDALNKGTQGEWRVQLISLGKLDKYFEVTAGDKYPNPICQTIVRELRVEANTHKLDSENAEQIVLSHNLLPSLLDSLEEMEREMEKMREHAQNSVVTHSEAMKTAPKEEEQ